MKPTQIAETYFDAWLGRDFDRLRSLLADDCTFEGPLATIDNADDCVAGLRGMSEILTGLTVRKRIADDSDVLTWFELETSVAPPTPTVNWTHVDDGLITAIKVAFDPRAIIAAG